MGAVRAAQGDETGTVVLGEGFMAEKLSVFDVVICSGGEVLHVVRATIETPQGDALLRYCDAHIVPAGKFKVGDSINPRREPSELAAGLPR
jgi:hypothetical protein